MTTDEIKSWNEKHPVGSKVYRVIEFTVTGPLLANNRIPHTANFGMLTTENSIGHDPRLAESRINGLELSCKELQEKVWDLGEQLMVNKEALSQAHKVFGAECDQMKAHVARTYTREQMVKMAHQISIWLLEATGEPVEAKANRILDEIDKPSPKSS